MNAMVKKLEPAINHDSKELLRRFDDVVRQVRNSWFGKIFHFACLALIVNEAVLVGTKLDTQMKHRSSGEV